MNVTLNPPVPLEQAKAILAAKAKTKADRQAKRDAKPVPKPSVTPSRRKNSNPGDQALPPARCVVVCSPNRNHVCDGYKAKYVEHTPERKERWEAQREEIRETRRAGRGVYCSECDDLMEDPDEAQWHLEDHGGRPERDHYAVDGEHDGDLDGYDDEPEEDYCEGDDDGYDCD